MLRILFFLLWVIPCLGSQAQGDIEIYANGHKYESFQAYQASKRAVAVKSVPTPVALNKQQEEYIRQAAKQMGIDVDFSKVKTFQVNQSKMSDATRHKLYVLSVENGVVDALQNFYQTWGQAQIQVPHSITSDQLQAAIQQAVITSKYPKLLISEPGKVRIMTLTTEKSDK